MEWLHGFAHLPEMLGRQVGRSIYAYTAAYLMYVLKEVLLIATQCSQRAWQGAIMRGLHWPTDPSSRATLIGHCPRVARAFVASPQRMRRPIIDNCTVFYRRLISIIYLLISILFAIVLYATPIARTYNHR